MIIIRDEHFDSVNKEEHWLLMQLVRRMRSNNFTCWPSNDKIMKDTGFSEKTLKKYMGSLIEKGLIVKRNRFTDLGRQTSNEYCLNTSEILITKSLKSETNIGGQNLPTPVKSTGGEGGKNYPPLKGGKNYPPHYIEPSIKKEHESAHAHNFENLEEEKQTEELNGLPPEEQRISEAVANAAEYFKKYPAMVGTMQEAAKMPDLTKKEIYEELKMWVRYHGHEFHFISNITKHINAGQGSFRAWMTRFKREKKKIDSNGSGTIYTPPKFNQDRLKDYSNNPKVENMLNGAVKNIRA